MERYTKSDAINYAIIMARQYKELAKTEEKLYYSTKQNYHYESSRRYNSMANCYINMAEKLSGKKIL